MDQESPKWHGLLCTMRADHKSSITHNTAGCEQVLYNAGMELNAVFRVSEFNEFINEYLGQIGEVVIEGELSELKINQNKWVFGTIKDESASIEIFGTVFQLANLRQLEPGMLVRIYGTPRLYEKTGRFSIFVNTIVPSGEGALQIAFEKLKMELEQEGLFDDTRKRVLPRFPQSIGLITAKDSQAYQDFVKVLAERMGGIKICFCPVQVQGKDSPMAVVNAIKRLNSLSPPLDLLVITRGGGSLEDLIGFNDERVVRAIFGSQIPVVSAVGHEGDVSLADLVADLRASTPSNAAELIVPDRKELMRQVESTVQYLDLYLAQSLLEGGRSVDYAVKLQQKTLESILQQAQSRIRNSYQQMSLFERLIQQAQFQLQNIQSVLLQSLQAIVDQQQIRLEGITRLLKSLDYQQVLQRGYSITLSSTGQPLRRVTGIKPQDHIQTMLQDGTLESVVSKTQND